MSLSKTDISSSSDNEKNPWTVFWNCILFALVSLYFRGVKNLSCRQLIGKTVIVYRSIRTPYITNYLNVLMCIFFSDCTRNLASSFTPTLLWVYSLGSLSLYLVSKLLQRYDEKLLEFEIHCSHSENEKDRQNNFSINFMKTPEFRKW